MADPTLVTNPDLVAQVATLNSLLTQVSAFLSHLSLGGATAHGLEWLKTRPAIAPIWNALSRRGKAIVGALLAGVGSLGVTAAFVHPADHPGTFGIVFSGVTAASIGQHVWSMAQSWALQQAWYQQIIKPTAVVGPPVSALTAGTGGGQPVKVVETVK